MGRTAEFEEELIVRGSSTLARRSRRRTRSGDGARRGQPAVTVRLILDPGVRVYEQGRVLVAAGRIMRLTDAGPAAVRALLEDQATPVERRLGRRLIEAGIAHP